MNINPLDTPGVPFVIELLNPNPTSRRTKDGPVYRLSFEVSKEVHDSFMASREGGLRLIGKLAVAPDTDEQPAHEAVNGKPKKERKQTEKTPYGDMWRELILGGFISCPGVREAVAPLQRTGTEKSRDVFRSLFEVDSISREVGPEQIYKVFPHGDFPAVKTMVEQAIRKAG